MQINHLKKQPFFYIIIAVVLYLSYLVLQPFFSAIVIAFLAAIFFKPVYAWLCKKFRNRAKLASVTTVVIVFFVILIPLVIMGGLTTNQIIQFKNDFGSSANSINLEQIIEYSNRFTSLIPGTDYTLTQEGLREIIDNGARAIGSFFIERLPDIGSSAFNLITWILIFIILLYSLLPLQDKLIHIIEDISPLDNRIDSIYFTRVIEMSKSMVKGTFLIAIVQGVVAGIFLTIVGVPYVLFWTLLMIFLGVIPMVGYGFVLIPISLVLLFTGGIWQGILLILTSFIIISNIDNFLRPKLVSKKAELHPALVILGVIGGLQVFGVLGFIYGPVIMILLVTTFEMYLKYYRKSDETASPPEINQSDN